MTHESLKDKPFSIRRDVLNLSIEQWNIVDRLDLSKITPRKWLDALDKTGSRGGFLTAHLNAEEYEFTEIVYQQDEK